MRTGRRWRTSYVRSRVRARFAPRGGSATEDRDTARCPLSHGHIDVAGALCRNVRSLHVRPDICERSGRGGASRACEVASEIVARSTSYKPAEPIALLAAIGWVPYASRRCGHAHTRLLARPPRFGYR